MVVVNRTQIPDSDLLHLLHTYPNEDISPLTCLYKEEAVDPIIANGSYCIHRLQRKIYFRDIDTVLINSGALARLGILLENPMVQESIASNKKIEEKIKKLEQEIEELKLTL